MHIGIHYATILPLLSILALAASLVNLALRDKEGHTRLLVIGATLAAAGWIIYTIPFITLDYRLAEVARNSNDGLDPLIRWAASWSGGGSSLYLFSALTAASTLHLMRRGANHRFTGAMAALLLASMVAALLNGAFDVMEEGGGIGINPLLKSYWILVHPPTTFAGYSMLLTAAIAILTGVRATRLLLAGWILLTLGITLGGYWSYETFGWGGYWAWDPVEISQLSVWLAAVAVIHSIGPISGMRRPMLLLLASSIPLALYVTRSGLSPLHSFAAANIGTAVLLAVSIVLLGIMLYIIAVDEQVYNVINTIAATMRKRSIPGITISIAGALLILIAIFVYASLMAPSLLTVIGIEATVPTMAEGVRFYHPILYPLFTAALALIPTYFLSKELKTRGIIIYLTLIIIVTITSIIVATGYKIAPLAPTSTNIMMTTGLTISLIVLSMLATSIIIGKNKRSRDLMLKTIHIGIAITYIGILLSGTYAFNDTYLEKYNLKKGESISIGDISIKIIDYKYEKNNGVIDLYTHIAGKRVTALAAWQGISMLKDDMASLVKELMLAQEEISNNETLKTIEKIITIINNIKDVDVYLNSVGSISIITENNTARIIDNEKINIIINNISVVVSIDIPSRQNLTDKYSYISLLINASSISIESSNLTNVSLIEYGKYYLVEFKDNVSMIFKDISIRIDRMIVASDDVRIGNSVITMTSPVILVTKGAIGYSGVSIEVPGVYDYGLYLYSIARFGSGSVMSSVVNSTLADVLLDPGILYSISSSGPGLLPLPSSVLDGVRLRVMLEVDAGGETITREAVIRFEANGEALGIHGLVTDTLIIKDGLGDLYINVRPPQVNGFFGVYHELLPYYLKEARTGLSEAEYISLVAVMAAGHVVGGAGSLDPNSVGIQVERGIIDLYLLSEEFDPEESTINTGGIVVAVKYVPWVNLVWVGVAVMVLGGVATLLAYRTGS